MLDPPLFVLFYMRGGQVAVPDHQARSSARRLELDHQPRIARFGREFCRTPGLDDALPFVDTQEDPVDVSIPGDEPPAGPGLDHRFPAARARGALPAVPP